MPINISQPLDKSINWWTLLSPPIISTVFTPVFWANNLHSFEICEANSLEGTTIKQIG